jgi:hypothetical protein
MRLIRASCSTSPTSAGSPEGSFDAVVCFGGPLGYVLGEADRALAELLRVTKQGGRVLLSVMSLLGTARAFFDQLPRARR